MEEKIGKLIVTTYKQKEVKKKKEFLFNINPTGQPDSPHFLAG